MNINQAISESYSPVVQKAGESISFVLPTYMSIEGVEALAAEFKQWPLNEKTSVTLDASRLENITTPGLQLILALQKTLTANGNALNVIGKRDVFIHAFKDAGLENFLSEPS